MAIVTLEQIKAQLNFTSSMGAVDDALLTAKIAAALDHLERWLGYKIADRFGGEEQEPVPPSLAEAVCQLAAWWYEQREAVGDAAKTIPYGITEIMDSYRERSF